MIVIAIAFAVGSVVTLTALGEGAKHFITSQFSFLGTDVLIMFPGRNETTGGMPPVTGAAARNITLDEVYHLQTRVSAVGAVAPIIIGSAEVAFESRARETIIFGTTSTFLDIREMSVALGRVIDTEDIRRANNECLLGQTLRRELFATGAVIGRLLRVGDYRCRVVGVLEGRGDAFGLDFSDSLIMPVASAQRLFNTEALFRVAVQIKPEASVAQAKQQVLATMTELHQGELDVTIVSPDALLNTLGKVISALTAAVAAIASISLLVAGLLIMNITLISVSQRTQEIGLLKALGGSAGQVLRLFLIESCLLAAAGIIVGIACAWFLVTLGNYWFAATNFQIPIWALLLAALVALATSLGFAWLPAKRASTLAPIVALQNRD